MKSFRNHIHIRNNDEALLLAYRFFEATTTSAEEEALKHYVVTPPALADHRFDEVRFVMGMAVAGKRSILRMPFTPSHTRHKHLRWIQTGIAAGLIGISLALSLTAYERNNRCVAYINDVEVTDPARVMQAMHHTASQMEVMNNAPSMESQLHSMFQTIDTEPEANGSLP